MQKARIVSGLETSDFVLVSPTQVSRAECRALQPAWLHRAPCSGRSSSSRGLMLCKYCHEILRFIADSRFCKWNLMGQWSRHWGLGALFTTCAVSFPWCVLSPLSLPLCSNCWHPPPPAGSGCRHGSLHLTWKYPRVQGCAVLNSKWEKTTQEVETKTVEERKNLLFPSLFEQWTLHFHFAQGPVNYRGPWPETFLPSHKLYVPLGIVSTLTLLSVASPLILWALCRPACHSFYRPCPSSVKDYPLCAAVWPDVESQWTVVAPSEVQSGRGKKRHQKVHLGIEGTFRNLRKK